MDKDFKKSWDKKAKKTAQVVGKQAPEENCQSLRY